MTETARDLVIVMTRGTDHELSSVAFTIANGGLTAGLKVSMSTEPGPQICTE